MVCVGVGTASWYAWVYMMLDLLYCIAISLMATAVEAILV